MSLTGMEGAIDALKDYLEANMTAKLAALDAEYGDFTLDDMKAYYVAEQPEVPEQPSMFLLGDASEVASEAPGVVEDVHTITLVVLATDQDSEILRRRLYRYVRALLELFRAYRSTAGYALHFQSRDYSPLYGQGGTFLADARMVVTLRKFET